MNDIHGGKPSSAEAGLCRERAVPALFLSAASLEVRRPTMRKYRGWSALPAFLRDRQAASLDDILVTPPVAAALLGYSKVRMTRLLEQEEIVSWAWFEPDKYHASEIMVSVRSLIVFGLQRGRLGSYDRETPLHSVIAEAAYEQLRRSVGSLEEPSGG